MKIKKIILLATSTLLLSSCGSNPVGGGGINEDNSFAMVTTWTTSGLVNHYDSNTSCEAFNYFVVEGMYRYVRSTDEIFCQLAAELPTHRECDIADYRDVIGSDAYDYYVAQGASKVTVTTGKIREDAKWQNGEPFTAKDVWAYYYMIHPTSSNYLAAVKAVDDLTVEYIWNPLKEPNNKAKELLLAQDKSGTVKYDEFSSYVDEVYKIVMQSPVNTNPNLWGAFNRFSTDDQISRMQVVRNNFYEYSPSWYIATGPFKLEKFTATQILLVKNEHYWNAENIGFEKIKLYSSNDLNQTYQLIQRNYVSYHDGFIQQDVLESMLDANENLVNLKMYDPGSIGVTFNTSKSIFTLPVRQAFQYILNREEVKDAANPYATTSYYPTLGMAESEAKTYMSEKHFNELPKYEYNQDKAKQLLEAQGWTKQSDGWHDANGNLVSLKLGAPSGHDISSTASEAVAAQLEGFGIHIDLLKSSNFYGTASDSNQYDLMLEWTDLNMSFSYPTGSYLQFSNFYSKWAKVERYPSNYPDTQKAGNVRLTFDGLDGDSKKYEFADYINSFYSIEGDELTYLVDVFNTGLSNLCLGIQLFQNVTASTINVGHVKGVPLEEYWSENRNVTYVPQAGTEDFFVVARTNLVYATNYLFEFGIYQPNTKK